MSIKTKDWTAQIDRMPGAPSFRTYGTVTVAHSGITPKLEMTAQQDNCTDLRLELILEDAGGYTLPVVVEKIVEYKVMGNSNVTGVSIYYEGKLLHHIDEILITH
jgi:hypothetical protein